MASGKTRRRNAARTEPAERAGMRALLSDEAARRNRFVAGTNQFGSQGRAAFRDNVRNLSGQIGVSQAEILRNPTRYFGNARTTERQITRALGAAGARRGGRTQIRRIRRNVRQPPRGYRRLSRRDRAIRTANTQRARRTFGAARRRASGTARQITAAVRARARG